MKQEHEMTPGVLVSGDMAAGDYKARCAVLEDELAELRKRVCVPEGYVVVPAEPTIDMSAAARKKSGGFITFGKAEQVYRSMIAAAPACPDQAEPLYITHRPLINNAINLLWMRRPVAPDVERVIDGLRAMLDGMPTPAEPAAEHWISAAHSAAPAPVERVEQEAVSYYERAHGEKSPTYGMSLGERIAHVGGRTNVAGYIEFDSVMAVSALIDHVLRDSPAPQPAPTAAQGVAGPTMLELLEKIDAVRMGDEESAHHVHGAAYWNNAVVACLDAVRKARQSGGAKA